LSVATSSSRFPCLPTRWTARATTGVGDILADHWAIRAQDLGHESDAGSGAVFACAWAERLTGEPERVAVVGGRELPLG
jgi:hypothetical protein